MAEDGIEESRAKAAEEKPTDREIRLKPDPTGPTADERESG
jgi:hypothetical protein